ncbi:L-threonylcarbamoyladenylate synthase [Neolewinella persica]|uniref:L-threonylcarbamoyladenylate synthase n=1 Tax=Neolewinella persica TaxID=70998 RepID=UPI00146A8BF3|nr:Sua5/YciO/YrdC/YwlC family protein [Neolewinella persica]
MNIRTNPLPEMHHPLPPLGSQALSTLHTGGLVLLPTANLWQLSASIHHPLAIDRLLKVCPTSSVNRPELVFSDQETLFAWCPKIHPRLYTLLSFHKRPLTLLVPAGKKVPLALIDNNGEVAVRLAMDSFCYRLCEDMEAPLVTCQAAGLGEQQLPTSFGKIRSDVLRAADYTVKRRQREELGAFRAVAVRYGGDGEIEFLR